MRNPQQHQVWDVKPLSSHLSSGRGPAWIQAAAACTVTGRACGGEGGSPIPHTLLLRLYRETSPAAGPAEQRVQERERAGLGCAQQRILETLLPTTFLNCKVLKTSNAPHGLLGGAAQISLHRTVTHGPGPASSYGQLLLSLDSREPQSSERYWEISAAAGSYTPHTVTQPQRTIGFENCSAAAKVVCK